MTTCRSAGARAHIRTWKSKRSDTGSVSTELVLLAPALVLMVLLIVLAGRAGQTVEQVRHAADQGARAASLVSRPAMAAAARRAALDDLAASGVLCTGASVVTTTGGASAPAVTVTVTCRVPVDGLAPLAASGQVVTASSTEAIDRYRGEP